MLKQWANFKFYQWLARNPSEMLDFMQQVYGDQSLGHSIVFQWCCRFHIGRLLLKDDVQYKHLTTHTEEKICEGQFIVHISHALTFWC
jgi:hypothetical protein